MSSSIKTIIATVGIAVVGVLLLIGLYMSAHNSEVSLRNKFSAQQKSNESSFDKTWKIIQQQAGVASEERETFRETYVEIMDATEGVVGKGMLASFFTQTKIEISPALFLKLMTTIEAQRESFHRDQQKLLEIKKDHDNVLTRVPSSWFVGGRDHLEAKIITSDRTTEAFSLGEDNNIELFNE
jgi:hypothetical protein